MLTCCTLLLITNNYYKSTHIFVNASTCTIDILLIFTLQFGQTRAQDLIWTTISYLSGVGFSIWKKVYISLTEENCKLEKLVHVVQLYNS